MTYASDNVTVLSGVKRTRDYLITYCTCNEFDREFVSPPTGQNLKNIQSSSNILLCVFLNLKSHKINDRYIEASRMVTQKRREVYFDQTQHG